MITRRKHQIHMRLPTRMTLFTAGLFAVLAFAVTALLHPPTAHAYDHKYYEFCTDSLGQTPQVCCGNAGGQWSDGECTDLAAVPFPVPTVTQQVSPPVVVAPPA